MPAVPDDFTPPHVKVGLDFLGWALRGASTIVVGSGQRWGDIDLTITPPKLLAKLAAEVHRNNMDSKHNAYLADKGVMVSGDEVDWGLVCNVVKTKATTPSAKRLLL